MEEAKELTIDELKDLIESKKDTDFLITVDLSGLNDESNQFER